MAFSTSPELKTLRRTLVYWRKEILAYFYCRLTNARIEGCLALLGFASGARDLRGAAAPLRSNGKPKLVIRRAYGYKSFRNYRLQLLNSCA